MQADEELTMAEIAVVEAAAQGSSVDLQAGTLMWTLQAAVPRGMRPARSGRNC